MKDKVETKIGIKKMNNGNGKIGINKHNNYTPDKYAPRNLALNSWSNQIGGKVRPMRALDPVIRAELCALLGIAVMADSFIPAPADHSEPSVGGPSSDPLPVVPPVLVILPPPVLQPVPLQAIPPPCMRPPIREPPSADSGFTGHSVTGVPFQFSLYLVSHHQFEACLMEQRFLQGQIQELLHIMRTRDVGSGERRLRGRLKVFLTAAAVRIYEATNEDITPDFLVEWVKWVLEELEEIGGPDLP
ncbi:hypothetical protein AgCh_032352 [Apium graveolens]